MISHSEIKNLLVALGFSLEEGTAGVWIKKYAGHEDYALKIDFAKEEINYGDKIMLGDRTTCNFKAPENFCCFRMCEQGLGKRLCA